MKINNFKNILVRPIMSEESMKEASLGRFTFEVDKEARKPEIKKAIERNFNVNVLEVQTAIIKGRKKRMGRRRNLVKLAPWKKAIVKLAQGQKIELFESLENEPKT